MAKREPRGTAGLPNTDSQPPVAGAVGPEQPSGTSGQSQDGADFDRFMPEGLSPEAQAAAREAARRYAQSQTTKQYQQLAEERRALELERARLEGQVQAHQPVAQPQPGQNPMETLQQRYDDAMAREDFQGAIDARADMRLLQLVPVLHGQQQTIQKLNQEIGNITRQQTESRLANDPVFQQHSGEIHDVQTQYNVPLEVARDIVAGRKQLPQVQQEAAKLRGDQHVAAAEHVRRQAAANIVRPEPTVGGVQPPPMNPGSGVYDRVQAAMGTLPEKAIDIEGLLGGTDAGGTEAEQELAKVRAREG